MKLFAEKTPCDCPLKENADGRPGKRIDHIVGSDAFARSVVVGLQSIMHKCVHKFGDGVGPIWNKAACIAELTQSILIYIRHLGNKHVHLVPRKPTAAAPACAAMSADSGASAAMDTAEDVHACSPECVCTGNIDAVECAFHGGDWKARTGGCITCPAQYEMMAKSIKDYIIPALTELIIDG
jgi:hypothetical protein